MPWTAPTRQELAAAARAREAAKAPAPAPAPLPYQGPIIPQLMPVVAPAKPAPSVPAPAAPVKAPSSVPGVPKDSSLANVIEKLKPAPTPVLTPTPVQPISNYFPIPYSPIPVQPSVPIATPNIFTMFPRTPVIPTPPRTIAETVATKTPSFTTTAPIGPGVLGTAKVPSPLDRFLQSVSKTAMSTPKTPSVSLPEEPVQLKTIPIPFINPVTPREKRINFLTKAVNDVSISKMQREAYKTELGKMMVSPTVSSVRGAVGVTNPYTSIEQYKQSTEFKNYLSLPETQSKISEMLGIPKTDIGSVFSAITSPLSTVFSIPGIISKAIQGIKKEDVQNVIDSLAQEKYDNLQLKTAESTRNKYNAIIDKLDTQVLVKSPLTDFIKKTIVKQRDAVTTEPTMYQGQGYANKFFSDLRQPLNEQSSVIAKEQKNLENMRLNYNNSSAYTVYDIAAGQTINIDAGDVGSFMQWYNSNNQELSKMQTANDTQLNKLMQEQNTAVANWHPDMKIQMRADGTAVFIPPEGWTAGQAERYGEYRGKYEQGIKTQGGATIIAAALSPENMFGIPSIIYRALGNEQAAKNVEAKALMGWDEINKELLPGGQIREKDVWEKAGGFGQRWLQSPVTQLALAYVGGEALGAAGTAAKSLYGPIGSKALNLGVGAVMAPMVVGEIGTGIERYQKGQWGELGGQLFMTGESMAVGAGGFSKGQSLMKSRISSALESGSTKGYLNRAINTSKRIANVKDFITKVESVNKGYSKEIINPKTGELEPKNTLILPKPETITDSNMASYTKFLNSAEAEKWNIRFGEQSGTPRVKLAEGGSLQRGTLTTKGTISIEPLPLEKAMLTLKQSFSKAGLTKDRVDNLLNKFTDNVEISKTSRPKFYNPNLTDEQTYALTRYAAGDESPEIVNIVKELTTKDIIGPKKTTVANLTSKEIDALNKYYYRGDTSVPVVDIIKDLNSRGIISKKGFATVTGFERGAPSTSSMLKAKLQQTTPIRSFLAKRAGAVRIQDIPLAKTISSAKTIETSEPGVAGSFAKRSSGALYAGKGGKAYYITDEGTIFEAMPHKIKEGGVDLFIDEGRPVLDYVKRQDIVKDVSSGGIRKIQVIKGHQRGIIEFNPENTESYKIMKSKGNITQTGLAGGEYKTAGYNVKVSPEGTSGNIYSIGPKENMMREFGGVKPKTPAPEPTLFDSVAKSVKDSIRDVKKQFDYINQLESAKNKIVMENRKSNFNSRYSKISKDMTEFVKTDEGSKIFSDYVSGKSSLKTIDKGFNDFIASKPSIKSSRPIETTPSNVGAGGQTTETISASEQRTTMKPPELITEEYAPTRRIYAPKTKQGTALATSVGIGFESGALRTTTPTIKSQPITFGIKPITRTQTSIPTTTMRPLSTGTTTILTAKPQMEIQQPYTTTRPIATTIPQSIQTQIVQPIQTEITRQGQFPIQRQTPIQTTETATAFQPTPPPPTEEITPIPPAEGTPEMIIPPAGGFGWGGQQPYGVGGGGGGEGYRPRGYKERIWDVPDIWGTIESRKRKASGPPTFVHIWKKPTFSKLVK